MSTDGRTTTAGTLSQDPRDSNHTISSSHRTLSSCASHLKSCSRPGSSSRRKDKMGPRHYPLGSKTPRVLLRLVRIMQILCSVLVLAAGIFSAVKFGVQEQEVLAVKEGDNYIDVDLDSLPEGRGDWRPVLLIIIAATSLVIFPLLTIFRRRRISVAIEVVLFGLWSCFMTLYIPTITAVFEPNCLHPKPPFQFLDDHERETLAIGIDIGRNSTDQNSLVNQQLLAATSAEVNRDIYTYCVMSQVGVAAGLIVIVFTLLSILLLLFLSYQSTDYLIEHRALELLQHRSLPSMVQQGISPITSAYQTISQSLPGQSRPYHYSYTHEHRRTVPDEENNINNYSSINPQDSAVVSIPHQAGGGGGSEEKSYSVGGTTLMNPSTRSNQESQPQQHHQHPIPETQEQRIIHNQNMIHQQDQQERTNHDRIRAQQQRGAGGSDAFQLQSWVTQGYQVEH